MTDELGALLRRLRAEAGLTQEQVAEASGVSVRTIRRLETGRSADHRLGTVHLLAEALKLTSQDRRQLAAVLTPTPSSRAAGPLPADVECPEPAPAPRAPHRLPAAGAAPATGALAESLGELARELRSRWQREEEQRQVHDPFPLPVRWRPAPTDLTDHPENVQRLLPGATPTRVDLLGDLQSVAEVYRRIPSGRLLVLGRAGSGKSILVIRLILDLLAGPEPSDCVPVVFSVGSWDATTTTLQDWLVDQLLRDHPHLARRTPSGSTLAAALIEASLILPVLDGFDEIAEGLRRRALESLNATSLPLVLTSRREEYEEAVQAARTPLVWAAGIELADLTLADVEAYLPRTARAPGGRSQDGAPALWAPLLAELRSCATGPSRNLVGVLTTPLMVVLARTMYSEASEGDPAELLDAERFPTPKSQEEHLLAGFVSTLYRPRAVERGAAWFGSRARSWDPVRAQRWLGYLAHHLVRLDRDRHDLAWWQISDSLRPWTLTPDFGHRRHLDLDGPGERSPRGDEALPG
ncbi:helix-turn-helix domain-containing protein, partial [Streptomyces sp. NPDC006879]|uniref:helix-turn-helix domain-containing protein n=1 Tax=Streptomyces sp. NPDC006879 TaxID=3364767 RepID=UPI00369A1771